MKRSMESVFVSVGLMVQRLCKTDNLSYDHDTEMARGNGLQKRFGWSLNRLKIFASLQTDF